MSGRERQSLLLPILIPVGVLAVIGAVLFLFSRVLLDVTATAATITALLVAASIMAVAAYVATRDKVSGASVWSMSGAVLGVTMLVGGVAILVGQPGAEEEEPFLAALVAPPDAAGTGFNTDVLQGPADEPFVIRLTNQDVTTHNVEIAPAEGEDAIVTGPDVVADAEQDAAIPALAEGEYFFFCVYHPTTMTGTLSLSPGGGPLVVAKDTEFDTDVIQLPPDTAASITLENQDAGVEHNIAIYEDDSAAVVLFEGERFPGIATETYEGIGPLAPGTYYFHCQVHPTMEGTVQVGAGGGEPPPQGDGEPPPDGDAPP
jgi:plastocyanin